MIMTSFRGRQDGFRIVMLLCVVAVLWAGLLATGNTPVVQAAGPPTVYFDPADLTAQMGQDVVVLVKIRDADNLGGFQFDLTYAPRTLEVKKVEAGPFLASTGRVPIPLGPAIDNEKGKVTFGAASSGRTSGATGAGILARVTFHPTAPGTVQMKLSAVKVLDAQGKPIETIVSGEGTIHVAGTSPPISSPAVPSGQATPTLQSPPAESLPPLPGVLLVGLGGIVLLAIGAWLLAMRRGR